MLTDAEIAAIRARHYVARSSGRAICAICVEDDPDWVSASSVDWPCDAARLLDALDALRATADALASATRRVVKRVEPGDIDDATPECLYGSIPPDDWGGEHADDCDWQAARDALAAYDAARGGSDRERN